MIKKSVLKELANKRLLDSKALLNNRRYQSSIYIGGYTVELLLKYNICKLFGFISGYPETKVELQEYKSKIPLSAFITIKNIKEFKTHNLAQLLIYSGKEFDIRSKALTEWTLLLDWNPEDRYLNKLVHKKEALEFYNAVVKVKSILIK